MNELIEKIREGGVLSGFVIGSVVAFTLASVHCDSQFINEEDNFGAEEVIEEIFEPLEDNLDKRIKDNTHVIEQILKRQGLQWNHDKDKFEPYDDNNELIQLIECKK